MTDDEMNPDICPSALDENGMLDRSLGEEWGKHKWYETTNFEGEQIEECAECGAIQEQTKCICSCGNEHTKSVS